MRKFISVLLLAGLLIFGTATKSWCPTSGGGVSGSGVVAITLDYKPWRTSLNEAYTGYIDVQLVISENSDFSSPDYNLDSASSQTSWVAFCAASATIESWSASGMPATDVRNILYTGASLTRGTIYYYRWRTYIHGDSSTYTDWKEGVLSL